jgi:pimeloyl-ACP methyl ester carboxylesterase
MTSHTNLVSRTIHAGEQRVHMKIAEASGPLVLLCHGFPESWHSWRHQLPALQAAGYRTVAMDLRGFGRSGKPTDPSAYRMTELVADCIGVVEALGEKSAIIVGHDVGAPIAWTAAWTRPDIFRAVVGMSVPFGGRGLTSMPGSPFGELRPREARELVTGTDRMFYDEYFCMPGGVAAREAERNLRGWLISAFYSLSADGPLPPDFRGVDLTQLSVDQTRAFLRAAMTLPVSGSIASMLAPSDAVPAWLDEKDLDLLVAEFEYSGLSTPMNMYKNFDVNWETLSQYQDRPVTVPSLYIGGDRDINAIWGQEAIRRAPERLHDLWGVVIIPQCGHWLQQEQPEAVNKALLGFLESL